MKPVDTFVSLQAAGGLLIFAATVAAVALANSSAAETYEAVRHTHFAVGAYGRTLDKPLHFWINEGLMTIFFFVVGLEIKREIIVGELARLRKAALPVAAAIGGMAAPALIYYFFNPSGVGSRGWAIPTATDIAFSIGVLSLLGARVPHGLTVFLAALAIADDLGAVLVIAIFYTAEISLFHLKVTGVLLLLLVAINVLGYRRPLPYILLGLLVWLDVYLSGVHSTVAGILVAFTFPARSACDTDTFLSKAYGLLERFRCAGTCGYTIYTNREHQHAVRRLEDLCFAVDPPLMRIEHVLSPWVAYCIVPVFALVNAGVHLDAQSVAQALDSPVALGVFLGLVLGKQVGIFSASFLVVRLGLAALPEGVSWAQLWGCAILCGIGFTMSIFIADLAFAGAQFLEPAKLGIIAASAASLVLGLTVLHAVSPAEVHQDSSRPPA